MRSVFRRERAEDFVGLLRDADESGSLGQLFEAAGSSVCAGRTQAAQNVQNRRFGVTAVRNFHRFPLRRSVSSQRRCPSLTLVEDFSKLAHSKL